MSSLRALLDRRRSVLVMGILNRTPDSFSDGGLFVDDEAALAHATRLCDEGADVIDVGAESTRPRAPEIAPAEQLARIGDIVAKLAARGVLVSIDTTAPAVAERALADGARVLNSVSLEPAGELAGIAARHGAALVLMHCRGSMSAMRGFSEYDEAAYDDVVADVARELEAAARKALAAGLPREDLLLDPGLGFAKNARQSLELCARLDEICALGFPVVVGPSRKSFLVRAPATFDEASEPALPPPAERLGATIAASLACAGRGAVMIRTHDVAALRQALAFDAALERLTVKSGVRSRPDERAHG